MSEEKEELLTDHDYDGIKEYDNPLPSWWLATFLITIIFGFIYWVHYFSGSGPTLQQELAVAMKNLEQSTALAAPAPEETEADFLAFAKDLQHLTRGGTVYTGKCAACHGPDLGGLIGPNLADAYWIHGTGKALDIAKVVRDGVPDKGMPPWGPVLSHEELQSVVAFLISKVGSTPANAKAPQGEKVE